MHFAIKFFVLYMKCLHLLSSRLCCCYCHITIFNQFTCCGIISGDVGGTISGDAGGMSSGDKGGTISGDTASIRSLDHSFIAAISICAISFQCLVYLNLNLSSWYVSVVNRYT